MAWKWGPREQARRTLAGEQGVVVKDWGGRLPIALVYPNRYAVGMGNLGIHCAYRLWNARPDVVCERAFPTLDGRGPEEDDALWVGKATHLRATSPILSLESQRPLGEFSVIAFSAAYELDYPHLVGTLRGSGIPLLSSERGRADPVVIAGGMGVTANPEPLAPFLDAVALGDAEPLLDPLTEALCEARGAPREEVWARLGQVPGIYVPALYDVEYGPDGRLTRLSHAGRTWREGLNSTVPLPGTVHRQVQEGFERGPAHTVIFSDRAEFGNLFLLEVSRGCSRGCAFCLAGHTSRPARYWPVGMLLSLAGEGLRYREAVGLVGAAVSDHPEVDELAMSLRRMGARLSVSSWRADALSETLLQALAQSGAQSVTLAPEAGTERLRRRIAKNITNEHLQRAAELAGRLGIRQIKLYFMVGLPGETEEDVAAIGQLSSQIAAWAGARVVVGISPFVPKAQTPFQRQGMLPAMVLKRRLAWLQKDLARRGIQARTESVAWSEVQAALARGGRTLAEALAAMGDCTLGAWRAALERTGVDIMPALQGLREGALPWAHIASGTQGTAVTPCRHK